METFKSESRPTSIMSRTKRLRGGLDEEVHALNTEDTFWEGRKLQKLEENDVSDLQLSAAVAVDVVHSHLPQLPLNPPVIIQPQELLSPALDVWAQEEDVWQNHKVSKTHAQKRVGASPTAGNHQQGVYFIAHDSSELIRQNADDVSPLKKIRDFVRKANFSKFLGLSTWGFGISEEKQGTDALIRSRDAEASKWMRENDLSKGTKQLNSDNPDVLAARSLEEVSQMPFRTSLLTVVILGC